MSEQCLWLLPIFTLQRMMSAKRHWLYSKKNPSMLLVLIKEAILTKMLYDKENKCFIDQDLSCSPTSSMKQKV